MKGLHQILTNRSFEHQAFYQIVYEWEDELSKALQLPLTDNWSKSYNEVYKRIPFLSKLWTRGHLTFSFLMSSGVGRYYAWHNTGDFIPCIIDFFESKEKYRFFQRNFKHCPLILISSKEAYQRLLDAHVNLPIHHWALSIADIYRITSVTHFEKVYDLVMVGRQNPVLLRFAKRYAESHPNFTYVTQQVKDDNYICLTSDGRLAGMTNTREQYFEMIRKSRCMLYATPGIDTNTQRAKDYNQVTPKFLEYIVSGCHILARYPKNPDTEYFELDKLCPSINTYEEFEERMDYCLSHDVDMGVYSGYIEKHYTSRRAEELKDIINTYKNYDKDSNNWGGHFWPFHGSVAQR